MDFEVQDEFLPMSTLAPDVMPASFLDDRRICPCDAHGENEESVPAPLETIEECSSGEEQVDATNMQKKTKSKLSPSKLRLRIQRRLLRSTISVWKLSLVNAHACKAGVSAMELEQVDVDEVPLPALCSSAVPLSLSFG